MPILPLILAVLVGLILVTAAVVVVNGMRGRGSMARSLDMTLFLFALPRFGNAGDDKKQPAELIAVMEQLYSSVATMRISGWNKFLYGDPYIALEMAVHHVGEQVHFYAAVPSRYADSFEKQVNGLFPTAQITRAPDYSIFNPSGAAAGGWMKLKGEPILPIATYTTLPADPLGALVSAMGKLAREGEGMALQLLVRPSSDENLRKLASTTARNMQAGNDFAKALKLARNPASEKKKDQAKDKDAALAEPPKVPTEFEAKLIKSLQAKASRPLFDCNVRLLASAADVGRAQQLADELAGAFAQYAMPDQNAFALTKVTGSALERLVFEYSFRLFNGDQKVPLSSEEVTSLFHFPVGGAVLPKVKSANFRVAEPPPGIPETGVVFGINTFQGVDTPLRLTRDDRRRHMYIIGQTGTGKSVTMQAMIAQDLAAGEGVTVVDPHGPLAEWTLANVPRERIDDVIYFNPSDFSHPMGLNMFQFDPANPQDKTLIIDELYEIMDKLYDLRETGGPMFERYFKNATFLMLDNYERRIPTLSDMSRVFVDEAYRKDLLSTETNQMVKQFWELEATKATGEQSLANFTGYITSKVDAFNSNDFLRPIINQQSSAVNFPDVIENKKILVVNLSKGKIGDLNANLLGMVIVGKLRRAALARDTKRTDLPDHYLYIDEFQNFTTDSIAVILSEARKYRLCLVMAHQFIKQLDEDVAAAVFGNVGTSVIYRVSPEDAEDPRLKTKFEPVFSPGDLSNIDNLNAYVSMLVNAQVGRPTNMRSYTEVAFNAGDPRVRDAIIEICRLRYGRPREEVEAEIQARFSRT